MTTTNETGVTYHFVATGLTVPLSRLDSRVMRRGQSLVVSLEMRALATGRDNSCVWDLTEAQQLQRFGKVMFRVGPWPGGDALEPGSFELDDARAAALREAAALPDPEQQRIAAAKVRERFGVASEATSKTLAHYS